VSEGVEPANSEFQADFSWQKSPKAPPLYILKSHTETLRTHRKAVVVCGGFVSGRQANHIVNYNAKRFPRGTDRYGGEEWDARRNTWSLRLNNPDELERYRLDAANTGFAG